MDLVSSPFGYYRAFEQVEWMRASLIAALFPAAVYKRHLRCVAGIYGGLGEQDRIDDETGERN